MHASVTSLASSDRTGWISMKTSKLFKLATFIKWSLLSLCTGLHQPWHVMHHGPEVYDYK